ncbi:MAG: ribonuclease P protein component [Accumulibacter sp.]|uniref:ribonuclease P protein component n=1 Tax=Accumulibacter sp. TaxID=2053492 RepID=UPI002FC3380C
MSGRPSTAGTPAVSATAFPKQYRLIRTDEYSSVFGFRRALKSRHFLLHYRPRSIEEVPGARLGLVVAKRFLRRSVDRNLVRRLAREQFRLMRSRLRSSDFVLRLAVRPLILDRQAMAQEIRGLLSRATSSRQ